MKVPSLKAHVDERKGCHNSNMYLSLQISSKCMHGSFQLRITSRIDGCGNTMHSCAICCSSFGPLIMHQFGNILSVLTVSSLQTTGYSAFLDLLCNNNNSLGSGTS